MKFFFKSGPHPLKTKARTKRACTYLLVAVATLFSQQTSFGDVAFLNRDSSITLTSQNLGGVEAMASTSDINAIFNQSFSGSQVHQTVSGGINTGTWQVDQFSEMDTELITAFGLTNTTMGGNGLGSLNSENSFDVEFESIGDTGFVLSGSHFGTPSAVGAKDFIQVQLQEFDGVVFQNMFSTGAGDSLNDGDFAGVLQDGGIYRFSVLSRANVFGNEANASGYDVQLAFNPVPEPGSVVALGLIGCVGLVRRRRS